MDPKSRDSQGTDLRRRTLGAALILLASFTAACDTESDSTDAQDEDHEVSAEASTIQLLPVSRTRQVPSSLLGRRVRVLDVGAVGTSSASPIAADGSTDAGDTGEADPTDGDVDPTGSDVDPTGGDVDPTQGDEADGDAEGDLPTCASSDTTAPSAIGRTVVLGADEVGMTPISPSDCVDVTDACDAAPVVELLWATSDEPEIGVAVDDRSPDVNDLGCGIGVRAERAAAGDGRVYTVGFRATDAAGNATEGLCTVMVEAQPGACVDSGAAFERDLRGYGCL